MHSQPSPRAPGLAQRAQQTPRWPGGPVSAAASSRGARPHLCTICVPDLNHHTHPDRGRRRGARIVVARLLGGGKNRLPARAETPPTAPPPRQTGPAPTETPPTTGPPRPRLRPLATFPTERLRPGLAGPTPPLPRAHQAPSPPTQVALWSCPRSQPPGG